MNLANSFDPIAPKISNTLSTSFDELGLLVSPIPFKDELNISYILEKPSKVEITIFNHLGQVVKRLTAEQQLAGSFHLTWDGQDTNGRSCSNGVYFIHFANGERIVQQKVLLTR